MVIGEERRVQCGDKSWQTYIMRIIVPTLLEEATSMGAAVTGEWERAVLGFHRDRKVH